MQDSPYPQKALASNIDVWKANFIMQKMIVALKGLRKIRERHKNQKIVFCSGCFDLTHAGHVLFFEDCKKHGDILVAMVGSDKVVQRDKGEKRPILNEDVRIKIIDSLKPVDYALHDQLVAKNEHPLHHLELAFRKLKPDTYVVNEDALEMPYREGLVQRHGAKLVVLKRWCPPEFEAISTSKIIEKIKKTPVAKASRLKN